MGSTFDNGPSTPLTPSDRKIIAARQYARDIVRAVPLKDPDTATYGRPAVAVDPSDPSQFEASSYVRSQNSYGAFLRAEWFMRLRYSGSDASQDIDSRSNWTVEEFIFDGNKVK